MNLREATDSADPLTTAKALCARGEFEEAREIVEGVIARTPGNRAAYELLDQIAEQQRFASVRAGHGFDWGEAMSGAWGWLLKAAGVACWIGALCFLYPLLFSDHINRHPQPGQAVVEPYDNIRQNTIPIPVRLLLCVGLGGAGTGLWLTGRRFNDD